MRHQKLELALERLSKEQDIQYIIEMNRISRLVHKAVFLNRQRRAINFSNKYVITNKDVQQDTLAKKKDKPAETFDENVSKILTGFDPENNLQDRRILFEVTHMRVSRDDF